MDKAIILISIIFPIAGGSLLFCYQPKTDSLRNCYCEAVAAATTILVWMAVCFGRRGAFTALRFTQGFTLSFHMDGLTLFYAALISIMWPLCLLYAFEYMEHAEEKNRFFAFYLMTYGITLGVAFSGNILTLYVFYEMLSLVTLPLVAHYEDYESLYAGRVYAAYTVGGAGLALIAVIWATDLGGGAFAYGGSAFDGAARSVMLLIYFFGFYGFGVKSAVFPLSYWLPTASVAPTPVTALLHAVAVVNSGVFAVTRLTWFVFRPEELHGSWVQITVLSVTAFTLLFEALQAVRERRFKKRLAISTCSNLSYMLFGILLMTPAGLRAGLSHFLFHSLIKISLFLCAGAFMHQTGNNYVFETDGVGWKMPKTFVLYTIGALSLTGIPLFSGFVSKWNLILSGIAEGSVPAIIGTVCLIAASFFCAIYTLSVSVRAFYPVPGREKRYEGTNVKDPSIRMLLPISVFIGANILFGIWPGPVMGFLGKIAEGLL